MINLCVPVLKRYDLLRELLVSVQRGTVQPHCLYVIDNGRNGDALYEVIKDFNVMRKCLTPVRKMGVAESWNWFIQNVPEERLIVNDDVTFAVDSLRTLVETPGDIVTGLLGSNACSCFVIPDSCVRRVGLFDEKISPGYAYYEDCDYFERMMIAGIDFTGVECGVVHARSQTLAQATPNELDEHNRKFIIAQENFIKKWGRMPHGKERQFA